MSHALKVVGCGFVRLCSIWGKLGPFLSPVSPTTILLGSHLLDSPVGAPSSVQVYGLRHQGMKRTG